MGKNSCRQSARHAYRVREGGKMHAKHENASPRLPPGAADQATNGAHEHTIHSDQDLLVLVADRFDELVLLATLA